MCFPQYPVPWLQAYQQPIPKHFSSQCFQQRWIMYGLMTMDGLGDYSIIPLHKDVPEAIQKDETLHSWLAAIDIIRVGKARELKLALDLLRKDINDNKNNNNNVHQ